MLNFSFGSIFLLEVTAGDYIFFIFSLAGILAALVVFFIITYWNTGRRVDASPYSGMPLRYATEIPYVTRDQVHNFIRKIRSYDNQFIDFERAAFCRETGRIFTDCITWTGAIRVNWSFITKRYSGNFVSWGSLSEKTKNEIRKAHDPLTEFQTEYSSKNPSPRLIEERFALSKPGPLYVDPESKVLVGWVIVPDTELEVLVVQKPIVVKLLNVEQKTEPKKTNEKK